MEKFALISVSDKTGIVEFARELNKYNYTILATGKTAELLLNNNISCTKIEDFTSFPEIFDGRVKTLQPKIFGGILMRRSLQEDIEQALENSIVPIDIVCVNLYPFPQVVKRQDLDLEVKIENIDIGGPSLIRAAAKNYKYVGVVTNPDQYSVVCSELENGALTTDTRVKLASAAFAYTSYYDTLIANFFEEEFDLDKKDFRINFKLNSHLRYGENPHQEAYLFGEFDNYFEILHGKEISYNNMVDFTAAVDLVNDLPDYSCAIVKHTNPCGAANADSCLAAYEKALSGDPVSAFGGIVAFNCKVDLETSLKLNDIFLEIIVAPDFSDEALDELKKKKNRRIIKIKKYIPEKFQFKSILGGVLVQGIDNSRLTEENLKLVTVKNYTEEEFEDLKFAWVICKHVKSNAIVYVKDKKILGVGAGQMSRVDSAKIAALKAKEFGHELTGAVAASDAFFPFADGLETIIDNGITAVIQPGGSVRDNEVIEAANIKNISMIFTGIRNFKH